MCAPAVHFLLDRPARGLHGDLVDVAADITGLDLEMLDPAAERVRTFGHVTEVVAVYHGEPCERWPFGNRLVAATVRWTAKGDVSITMECTGGEPLETARSLMERSLRDAAWSSTPDNGALITGPQFRTGRGFAVRLARALRVGDATLA